MTEANKPDDRHAQVVAAFGFVLQLASLGTLVGLAIWSKSDAIWALARLVMAGLPIWFILLLVFKQSRKVSAEKLETAELRRAQAEGTSDALFELDDEALLLEQNRLRWMLRWLLPSVTVIVSLFFLIGHLVGWGWSFDTAFATDGLRRTDQPTLIMWFIAGVGFLSFLYSRVAIADSRIPNWRLLRAGATCMSANALACLCLFFALMAGTALGWAEPLFAYIVRVVLFVLGIELAANFIFDFYRPRTPGLVPRPSFDSRLLGLIGDPGGIAKSIADAINYQFGFEVSSTWFYQLLQRWLFPIMVFTFIVVLALSSVVIVDADEQVLIERWGSLVNTPATVHGPGMHFKWPFPKDIVYRAPVKRVRELVIGEASEEEKDDKKAILWTEAHEYVPELMLLVAAPRHGSLSSQSPTPRDTGSRVDAAESVPVNLLKISVPIEYRVKDIEKYLHRYEDPVKVMEAIAYQHLTEYGARVDIDELMGPGREALNEELNDYLQKRLDDLDTGIEIVFAGIRGAHPTAEKEVAKAFQGVVTAQTQKSATINAAEGEARKILTAVAGTETRAKTLNDAIRAWERLQADPDTEQEQLIEAWQGVDDLLIGNPKKGIPPLSGEAAARISDAKAGASRLISEASAKVRAFKTEVIAFQAAPELYKQRKMLEIWSGLDAVRKYLIDGDPEEVIIIYDTQQEAGLDQILSEGVKKERDKQRN